jgi:sterol desaturase/sphingolipid hydroxylase (fatty acid hydroxylase superfamily)
MPSQSRGRIETALRYGLYPALAGFTLAYVAFELCGPPGRLGSHYGYYLALLVGAMVVIEWLHPMRPEWRMTRATFLRRDLPYLAIGTLTIGAAGATATWALREMGITRPELHASLPLVPSVMLILVLPEFIWYWVHRLSHEARGAFGRWLWSVHVPHHLPQQLYVMMHVVAHPLNTLVVRLILTAPAFFLGFSAESIFVASAIIALQGVVSHFNVDMRVGWLNYILVGNELHRYHHSADLGEAKNFGNIVPLWDLVFGTFVYRPGAAPARLGVTDSDAYPPEHRVARVLALPFSDPRADCR